MKRRSPHANGHTRDATQGRLALQQRRLAPTSFHYERYSSDPPPPVPSRAHPTPTPHLASPPPSIIRSQPAVPYVFAASSRELIHTHFAYNRVAAIALSGVLHSALDRVKKLDAFRKLFEHFRTSLVYETLALRLEGVCARCLVSECFDRWLTFTGEAAELEAAVLAECGENPHFLQTPEFPSDASACSDLSSAQLSSPSTSISSLVSEGPMLKVGTYVALRRALRQQRARALASAFRKLKDASTDYSTPSRTGGRSLSKEDGKSDEECRPTKVLIALFSALDSDYGNELTSCHLSSLLSHIVPKSLKYHAFHAILSSGCRRRRHLLFLSTLCSEMNSSITRFTFFHLKMKLLYSYIPCRIEHSQMFLACTALSRLSRCRLSPPFAKWRSLTDLRRTQSEVAGVLLRRSRLFSLKCRLSQWRQQSRRKWQASAESDRLAANEKLERDRMDERLSAALSNVFKVRSKADLFLKCRGFRSLSAAARQAAKRDEAASQLMRTLSRFHSRCMNMRVAESFERLAAAAEMRAFRRDAVQEITSLLSRWASRTTRVNAKVAFHRLKSLAALSRRQCNGGQAVVRAWTRRQSRAELTSKRLAFHLLKTEGELWHRKKSAGGALGVVAKRITRRVTNERKRRAFEAMRERAELKRLRGRAVETIENIWITATTRRSTALLKGAFQRMKERAMISKRKRVALCNVVRVRSKTVRSRLFDAFVLWRSASVSLKADQTLHETNIRVQSVGLQLLSGAVSKKLKLRVIVSFFQWKDWTQTVAARENACRTVVGALQRWLRSSLGRGFLTWKAKAHLLERKQTERDIACRSIFRSFQLLLRSTLGRGFRTWKLNIDLQQRKRADYAAALGKLRSVSATRTRNKLFSSLSVWKELAFSARSDTAAFQSSLGSFVRLWESINSRRAWSCFLRWKNLSLERDIQARSRANAVNNIRKIILHWIQGLLSRSFTTWKDRTERIIRKESDSFGAVTTLLRVTSTHSFKSVRRSFGQWRAVSRSISSILALRGAAVKLLLTATWRRERRLLGVFYRLWIVNACKIRFLEARTVARQQQVCKLLRRQFLRDLRFYFGYWKSWTDGTRENLAIILGMLSNIEAVAERNFAKGLRRAFDKWQRVSADGKSRSKDFALACKIFIARLSARATAELRLALSRWKEATRLRGNFGKALISRARKLLRVKVNSAFQKWWRHTQSLRLSALSTSQLAADEERSKSKQLMAERLFAVKVILHWVCRNGKASVHKSFLRWKDVLREERIRVELTRSIKQQELAEAATARLSDLQRERQVDKERRCRVGYSMIFRAVRRRCESSMRSFFLAWKAALVAFKQHAELSKTVASHLNRALRLSGRREVLRFFQNWVKLTSIAKSTLGSQSTAVRLVSSKLASIARRQESTFFLRWKMVARAFRSRSEILKIAVSRLSKVLQSADRKDVSRFFQRWVKFNLHVRFSADSQMAAVRIIYSRLVRAARQLQSFSFLRWRKKSLSRTKLARCMSRVSREKAAQSARRCFRIWADFASSVRSVETATCLAAKEMELSDLLRSRESYFTKRIAAKTVLRYMRSTGKTKLYRSFHKWKRRVSYSGNAFARRVHKVLSERLKATVSRCFSIWVKLSILRKSEVSKTALRQTLLFVKRERAVISVIAPLCARRIRDYFTKWLKAERAQIAEEKEQASKHDSDTYMTSLRMIRIANSKDLVDIGAGRIAFVLREALWRKANTCFQKWRAWSLFSNPGLLSGGNRAAGYQTSIKRNGVIRSPPKAVLSSVAARSQRHACKVCGVEDEEC